MKYTIGTPVRISAVGASKVGGIYPIRSNPLGEIGVVYCNEGRIRVHWSGGAKNSYLYEDLDPVITQYTDKDLEEIVG